MRDDDRASYLRVCTCTLTHTLSLSHTHTHTHTHPPTHTHPYIHPHTHVHTPAPAPTHSPSPKPRARTLSSGVMDLDAVLAVRSSAPRMTSTSCSVSVPPKPAVLPCTSTRALSCERRNSTCAARAGAEGVRESVTGLGGAGATRRARTGPVAAGVAQGCCKL